MFVFFFFFIVFSAFFMEQNVKQESDGVSGSILSSIENN